MRIFRITYRKPTGDLEDVLVQAVSMIDAARAAEKFRKTEAGHYTRLAAKKVRIVGIDDLGELI